MESIKQKFGDVIEELIKSCPSPGKHAARNAISHMNKAWLLKEIDKEMAVFRGITGEEESAAAVFHSVMRRKYSDAKKLDVTSHVHKTALHPFLQAVGAIMNELLVHHGYNPTLEFHENENTKQFKTRVTVGVGENEKWAYIIPPLNFKLALNNELHDFNQELAKIATDKNRKNISNYVKKLAKRRHQLLYSTSSGIPTIEGGIEQFLTYRETVIYTNLLIFLLIDPYKDKQEYVQQCLWAFLKMLPHLRGQRKRKRET
jgi:hypothetical protein